MFYLNKPEEYKSPYYKVEERKMEIDDFKSRLKDPVYPYYQSKNDILSNAKPQPILVDDNNIFKPQAKGIDYDNPFVVRKPVIDLAQPALITSNNKRDDKRKKYELDFSKKNRMDDNQIYRPSDSYAKKVLHVQQSLPELNIPNRSNKELDR